MKKSIKQYTNLYRHRVFIWDLLDMTIRHITKNNYYKITPLFNYHIFKVDFYHGDHIHIATFPMDILYIKLLAGNVELYNYIEKKIGWLCSTNGRSMGII